MEENEKKSVEKEISYSTPEVKKKKLVKEALQKNGLVDQIIAVKHKISFFRELEDEEIKILISDVLFKKFRKNETIFRQGEKDNGYVYYILKGSIKISITDQLGVSKVITTIYSGSTIGEMQIVLRSQRTANCIVAEDDTILLGFTISEDIPKHALTFSKFYRLVAKEMAKKVSDTNKKVK